MATRFPVSYSAQAAMYANGTPSQAAGTYYLQGGASDVSQIIEGNLRVTGDLQVDGNEVVGGSLAAASMAATGAVTGASVAATGTVTGATVAATGAVSIAGANVPGSNLSCPGGSTQTLGNILCNSVTTTGNVIVPNGAAYKSSAALGAAPGVSGLAGTRIYTVSIPAAGDNIDIGLSAIINDTVPHQLAVTVIGAGAPGNAPFASYGSIQSYPAATGQAPNLQTSATGNGYSWNQFGGAGTYNLGLNGASVATTATVIITILF